MLIIGGSWSEEQTLLCICATTNAIPSPVGNSGSELFRLVSSRESGQRRLGPEKVTFTEKHKQMGQLQEVWRDLGFLERRSLGVD